MNQAYVLKELKKIKGTIVNLIEETDINDYYDHIVAGKIDFTKDEEGDFLKPRMEEILKILSDASEKISKITNEIIVDGIATKGCDNRYYLDDIALCCGKKVEALVTLDGKNQWINTRIEHITRQIGNTASGDYVLYDYPNAELSGIRIRIRGKE